MNTAESRVLVLVSCYNEQGRVGAVVGAAHAALPRADVVVIDDGSRDESVAEARAAFPPAQQDPGAKALAYFEKNRERMRYNEFRARGYFIGSGVVEAACKTLVAQRLKGSGMHWSEKGLGHILALRTAILSHRYEEFWRCLHTTPAAA